MGIDPKLIFTAYNMAVSTPDDDSPVDYIQEAAEDCGLTLSPSDVKAVAAFMKKNAAALDSVYEDGFKAFRAKVEGAI